MTHQELNTDVANYHGIVYRLAYGCTGNRSDAEDVTQETFLRLYQCAKTFADGEHKKAFLIRVTVNLCKNLRKSAWASRRSELSEDIPANDGLNEAESEAVFRAYIKRLKPIYRAVIYLHYYEGYPVKEAADILKISEPAVTKRLQRAREQLKTQLITNMEVLI